MTFSNKTKNIALACIVFVSTLLLVELVFMVLNRHEGIHLRYVFSRPYKYAKVQQNASSYHTLDPLLGYTYSAADSENANFLLPSVYADGFVFYNATTENVAARSFERPVIVTLGGSTTEPFRWGSSWPEELAVLMKRHNIKGTVINGGIGGYSSSQELLKLLRDGLEFSPDIVLTYHGVNDRGWIDVSHPLSVPYISEIMEGIVRANTVQTFFPNTHRWIQKRIKQRKRDVLVSSVSKGVTVRRSNAQNLVRNVRIISALTKAWNAEHISILQPLALTGKYGERIQKADPEFYQRALRYSKEYAMYQELYTIAGAGDFPMLDFTGIFDTLPETSGNVFLDGCHVTKAGNVFLAEKILEVLHLKAHGLQPTYQIAY